MIICPEDYRYPNSFVVYSHTLGDPNMPPEGAIGGGHWFSTSPAWIGLCRLRDVLCSPDAYRSPAWCETVLPCPAVRLDVLSKHASGIAALRAQIAAVRLHRPRVNALTGKIGSGPLGRGVRCLETGVEYETAAAAARAHGIFPSQMSAYLNGKYGATLRGLTFKRM